MQLNLSGVTTVLNNKRKFHKFDVCFLGDGTTDLLQWSRLWLNVWCIVVLFLIKATDYFTNPTWPWFLLSLLFKRYSRLCRWHMKLTNSLRSVFSLSMTTANIVTSLIRLHGLHRNKLTFSIFRFHLLFSTA